MRDFGNAGLNGIMVRQADCEESCSSDPKCGAYMFGWQPVANAYRCATYSHCSRGGSYEDGNIDVYRRMARPTVQHEPSAIVPELTSNCFVLLAEPLSAPPFPEAAVAKMRKYLLANLNQTLTDATTGTDLGGSNRTSWTQRALSVSLLLRVTGAEVGLVGSEAPFTSAVTKGVLATYIESVRNLHRDGIPSGDASTAEPVNGRKCRQQTDGPALRSQALIEFLLGGLAKAEDQVEAWGLIQSELGWLLNGTGHGAAYAEPSCDIWEESVDSNFLWNRMAARLALLQGVRAARRMERMDLAEVYLEAAEQGIGDPIFDHQRPTVGGTFITECSTYPPDVHHSDCEQLGKDIDSAVILSLVHSGWLDISGSEMLAPANSPTAGAVARTVHVYTEAFCDLFPINQEDSGAGIPGVLYGRKRQHGLGGGNPSVVVTAALAALLYQAAQKVAKEPGIVNEEDLAAWRMALHAQDFRATARQFVAAGDSVLSRLRHHADEDGGWHLHEEIHGITGKRVLASDFMWSYAEVLLALHERAAAVGSGALAPVSSAPDAPEGDGASRTCFVGLGRPLDVPPFPPEAVAKMRGYFLANLNLHGTGAMTASPGEVPALHNCCEGGYNYDWVRDGGLSLAALQRIRGSDVGTRGGDALFSDAKVKEIMDAYVGWVKAVQARNGSRWQHYDGEDLVNATVDSNLEPKWDIESGMPYKWNWCRIQSDGPGTRAQALIQYALGDLVDDATRKEIWELVEFDLDWLAQGQLVVEAPTCDLWEETTDRGFLWNRVTMRSALLAGVALADKMRDWEAVVRYRNAVEDIGDPITDHLKFSVSAAGTFLTECPVREEGPQCKDKGKSIDSAVILALIHAGHAYELFIPSARHPLHEPITEVVARTVQVYNAKFCDLYSINQKDSSEGVPGILYGRYAKDEYGGGNPWQLLTAALASLMYQTAKFVAQGNPLSPLQLDSWQAALFASFGGTPDDFVAAGDAILTRLVHHIEQSDDWHLYEQIDRETGKQYNAKDLTWSYAEVLSALTVREQALNISEIKSKELAESDEEVHKLIPMLIALGCAAGLCIVATCLSQSSQASEGTRKAYAHSALALVPRDRDEEEAASATDQNGTMQRKPFRDPVHKFYNL